MKPSSNTKPHYNLADFFHNLQKSIMTEDLKTGTTHLKRIFVASRLPEALQPLKEIAGNLWWSWHKDAIDLFESLQPETWETVSCNPLTILDRLGSEKALSLAQDPQFMEKVHKVYADFQLYMSKIPNPESPRIVYFSMEFGLHISVRLYSGGLGVLAGDYLKEASDQGIPLTGIGLLYRYGYFQQHISLHGDQINEYPPQEYTKMPMEPVRDRNGEWLKIQISLPGRMVWAKLWSLLVGRIKLYLLDTDIAENSRIDRTLTHQLYGGDNEHRLKQEILLGIGGIRAMEAIGIQGDVYHCNEGHAAFMTLERIRFAKQAGYSLQEARELVKATSLFTTHTPVPAGHDYFPEDLLYPYFQDYIPEIGLSWSDFMAMGKINKEDTGELFSMSHLAIHNCRETNGVSALHGAVSREMFKDLFPGYHEAEVPIGYVTNGIHYPTWIASEWHQLFKEYLSPGFLDDLSNKDLWEGIYSIPSKRMADTRTYLKRKLLDAVKKQLKEDLTRRGEKPAVIFETLNQIKGDALILGFARRFATYKRAHLIFSNKTRLAEIINQAGKPVIFLYAGKAHPADAPGQKLIKEIVQISKSPEFLGKVIFLEGYNMELAKLLVQGVDMWLNTPTRPKEASGTSGMKAAINGVINFSVLDGWWAEGYRPDAGWALPLENTYPEANLQDELDAETLYNILEMEIIPAFFNRNENGISEQWIQIVKNTIAKVGPDFTTKRMMDDYFHRYYYPQWEMARKLRVEKNKITSLCSWKNHIEKNWEGIYVTSKEMMDTDNHALPQGDGLSVEIQIFRNGIDADSLGLEFILYKRISETKLDIRCTQTMNFSKSEGEYTTYKGHVTLPNPGVFEYGFRLYPCHALLPKNRYFQLVKWL
jgi:alpha-glucan phosphorylase-like protein